LLIVLSSQLAEIMQLKEITSGTVRSTAQGIEASTTSAFILYLVSRV